MMLDWGSTGFDFVLACLLYFVAAPWVAMALPQCRTPIRASALGAALFAVQGFAAPFLYRLGTIATLYRTFATLCLWGGLAATVVAASLALKEKSEQKAVP